MMRGGRIRIYKGCRHDVTTHLSSAKVHSSSSASSSSAISSITHFQDEFDNISDSHHRKTRDIDTSLPPRCRRRTRDGSFISSLSPRAPDQPFEQLDLSSFLVGRESEQWILLQEWKRAIGSQIDCRLQQQEKRTRAICVHGESGVGKSHLVSSALLDTVVKEDGGIFVSGKFDAVSSHRVPFHAIIDALGDLLDVVASGPHVEKIGTRIQKELGASSDLLLLTQFVSVPHSLLDLWKIPRTFQYEDEQRRHDISERVSKKHHDNSTKGAEFTTEPFRRLVRVCRVVVDCIARVQPVLFFLDDVQWASKDCLTMIKSLLSVLCAEESKASRNDNNDNTKGILFVLAFRDGYRTMERLVQASIAPASSAPENWTIVDMPLKVFRHTDVVSFLSNLPFDDTVNICQLSTIIFEKTKGSPFLIVQFLELMLFHELFTWSASGLELKCLDVRGVLELDVSEEGASSSAVNRRLSQLSSISKMVLILASHLGFEFQRDVLVKVATAYSNSSTVLCSEEQVDDILKEAVQERLLVMGRDDTVFFFMHDRVRECFFDAMVCCEEERKQIYRRIGLGLKDSALELLKVQEAKHDDVLFIAVDSLNKSSDLLSTDESPHMELINLNIHASERAAAALSFSSAASYSECAIEILRESCVAWSYHYILMLHLHENLVRMYCHCRKMKEAHRVLDVILANARTVHDKQTALHLRFLTYELEGRDCDAICTALAALHELGVKTPEHPCVVSLAWIIVRAWNLVRHKMKSKLLLELPAMEDERLKAVVSWYHKLESLAGYQGNEKLMLFCSMQVLSLSVKYGRTKWSPSAFAHLGFLEVLISKNVDKACGTARLALDMLDAFDAECDTCWTQQIVQWGLLAWREPIHACLPALNQAAESGFRNGEAYHAITILGGAVAVWFHVGWPLVQTEHQIRVFVERIEALADSVSTLSFMRCYWQTVQNLLGWSDDPLVLSGDIMCESEVLVDMDGGKSSGPNRANAVTILLCKLLLACHFRSLEASVDLSLKLKKIKGSFTTVPLNFIPLEFFTCLTFLDKANLESKGRRRSLIEARRSYNALRGRARESLSFAGAVFGILEAEMEFVKTSKMNKLLYDIAIEKALNEGFLNYAAIACERAGLALLEERGMMDAEVCAYFTHGLRLNERWEAYQKVEWFKKVYFGTWESKRYPLPRVVRSTLTANFFIR